MDDSHNFSTSGVPAATSSALFFAISKYSGLPEASIASSIIFSLFSLFGSFASNASPCSKIFFAFGQSYGEVSL